MKPVLKQPSEDMRLEFDFAPAFGGAAISAINNVSIVNKGPAGLVLGAPEIQGDKVRLMISGGVDGARYLVSVLAQTALGDKNQIDVDVLVADLTWAIPDGASQYLTATDYLARFPVEETILLTDEYRSGVIDKTRLFAALDDAASIIDGYVGKLYAVPVIQPNNLLMRICADIARYQLHNTRVTAQVEERYKNAMASLLDISRGAIKLALPLGAGGGTIDPQNTGSGTILHAQAPKRFNRDGY
jgi:phage gp36-like protein